MVCNVAGIGGFYNTVDMPLDRWEKILAVNLTGPFLVCRATLPHLLGGGGVIVNVASNTALMGQSYSAAYCASKAGLLMFSKALAAEYLSRGVRVNVVAPGGTDTPLMGTFELPEGADFKELTKIMTPMGFSTPAEIAASDRLHRLRRIVLHHRCRALGRRRADHLNIGPSAVAIRAPGVAIRARGHDVPLRAACQDGRSRRCPMASTFLRGAPWPNTRQ